jgi:hypothetical protein
LILRNIALSKTGPQFPTVFILPGGAFVKNEGVSVIGTGSNTNAGVRVEGHFHMKGGKIYGHRRLAGGGNFVMI